MQYRDHEGLNRRIQDYQVRLGFGMHVGWAIEGLIGSEYKMDASYLSPHVNISMKLEEANKIYGVPLVISEAVFRVLSEPFKRLCRLMDNAQLKGTAMRMKLYTVDV